MKQLYKVPWRMYGCKEWCEIKVHAYCSNDALAAAAQTKNNHMIQFNVPVLINQERN